MVKLKCNQAFGLWFNFNEEVELPEYCVKSWLGEDLLAAYLNDENQDKQVTPVEIDFSDMEDFNFEI